MTELNDKLHQYATGTAKGCQHPINKVMPVNDYKDVCVLCGKMFVMAFHEEDLNPATMTRATSADIFRVWRKLYGMNVIPDLA